MGQLIDKTVLRKELSKLPSEMGFVRKSDVMQILGNQKCVYNVDKVVKKLNEELKLADEEKLRCVRENILQFDEAKGYARGIDVAIDIVRKGGLYESNY